MSDGHTLAKIIRDAGKTPPNEVVDLVSGKVTSVKPLKVKVENRELTQSFLIVGAMCKETKIKHEDLEIVIFEGLKKGDKVMMLKVCRGQKYYILQKDD